MTKLVNVLTLSFTQFMISDNYDFFINSVFIFN